MRRPVACGSPHLIRLYTGLLDTGGFAHWRLCSRGGLHVGVGQHCANPSQKRPSSAHSPSVFLGHCANPLQNRRPIAHCRTVYTLGAAHRTRWRCLGRGSRLLVLAPTADADDSGRLWCGRDPVTREGRLDGSDPENRSMLSVRTIKQKTGQHII